MDDFYQIEQQLEEVRRLREGPFLNMELDPWDWIVEEPQWMLDKLIPQRSIGMLYGPSNSGKSHLMCDLIATVIAGHSHWQERLIQSGDIVLFSESIGHIRARLKAYLGDQERKNKLYSLPTMSLDIANIRHLGEFLSQLEVKPIACMFDTTATMFSFEENDNREASKLIKSLEEFVLPQLDPLGSILLTHHTSKISEGRSARGASALIGNIDYSIRVSYDKERNVTEAHWEKDRWRLVEQSPTWEGEMYRVPVAFKSSEYEMSVLKWSETNEELRQVEKDTKRAIENQNRVDETLQIIDQNLGGFIQYVSGSVCVAAQQLNKIPIEFDSRKAQMIKHIESVYEVEPVYSTKGAKHGVKILHRKGV